MNTAKSEILLESRWVNGSAPIHNGDINAAITAAEQDFLDHIAFQNEKYAQLARGNESFRYGLPTETKTTVVHYASLTYQCHCFLERFRNDLSPESQARVRTALDDYCFNRAVDAIHDQIFPEINELSSIRNLAKPALLKGKFDPIINRVLHVIDSEEAIIKSQQEAFLRAVQKALPHQEVALDTLKDKQLFRKFVRAAFKSDSTLITSFLSAVQQHLEPDHPLFSFSPDIDLEPDKFLDDEKALSTWIEKRFGGKTAKESGSSNIFYEFLYALNRNSAQLPIQSEGYYTHPATEPPNMAYSARPLEVVVEGLCPTYIRTSEQYNMDYQSAIARRQERLEAAPRGRGRHPRIADAGAVGDKSPG